jgi:hypothetical protein
VRNEQLPCQRGGEQLWRVPRSDDVDGQLGLFLRMISDGLMGGMDVWTGRGAFDRLSCCGLCERGRCDEYTFYFIREILASFVLIRFLLYTTHYTVLLILVLRIHVLCDEKRVKNVTRRSFLNVT